MKTLPVRFWTRVNKSGPNGCWQWTASKSSVGYGAFWRDGNMRGAHRLAYEALVGPIPAGLQLDHLCGNRACVNPAHLEPVTGRENYRRGRCAPGQPRVFARKTACRNGHPLSGANLYVAPNGDRACQTCRRAAVRRWKLERATA